VPPKCSLFDADYESHSLLVRLDTAWIEVFAKKKKNKKTKTKKKKKKKV
jgi:hypothetical protein